MRVMRMLTASSRAPARRKRPISKPSMPNAFTTRKPEIVSCRISEMSFQRRSDVSFEARSRWPSRSSGHERERHADERQEREPPVHVEQHRQQAQDREALP